MNDYKNLRIIFMGTPDFAVASLDKLVSANCNVIAVVTAPDKPAGRGMLLQQSAVKKYAIEKKIAVLQPEKLKNVDFLNELKQLNANLHIVVAFRMLPELVWNMPPLGTINVHGSLLPQYRGAAPINWAIINGEKFTGITTFKLKHEIDTGNILMQEKIEINETENAGDLHDKMKLIGANVLLKTVEAIANKELQEIEQPQHFNLQTLHHAPKIFTETCEINFAKTVDEVYNLIRGLSPYPAAFTFINNKKVKIFTCKKEVCVTQKNVGEFVTDNKTYLKFCCANGYIEVIELQIEGKKRINITDFLKGFRG